jgi:hypothetical protein
VRENEKEEEDVVRVKGHKKPGNRIVSSDESGSSSEGSGSSGTVISSLKQCCGAVNISCGSGSSSSSYVNKCRTGIYLKKYFFLLISTKEKN